ncbi:MAG TPA: hypothetical protein VGL91_15360, partial [Acidobacteriota bacterium]
MKTEEGRKRKAESRKQEADGRKQEAGGRRQEAGDRKQERRHLSLVIDTKTNDLQILADNRK